MQLFQWDDLIRANRQVTLFVQGGPASTKLLPQDKKPIKKRIHDTRYRISKVRFITSNHEAIMYKYQA